MTDSTYSISRNFFLVSCLLFLWLHGDFLTNFLVLLYVFCSLKTYDEKKMFGDAKVYMDPL